MKPYYDEGGITIYHGDCREVLPTITADVMVTDPPYGISYASNQAGRFNGVGIQNDSDVSVRDSVLALWHGPAAVFGSWKMRRPDGTHTLLTWDKGEGVGMGDLSIPWRPNTEEIYIIGKGWRGHRGSSVIRDTSVVSWSGDGPSGKRLHPNEKPIPLLRQIIEKAPLHPVVIDPFMGSGTTLRAAKDLGRRAVGIELEERYCEIAANRLAQEVLDFGEAA
jgi:site-specific DNA-methyltransferase (adenine-specific)